ncbi:hypothetical protein [[Phormidium ambiguum] IAM M-71]|uniref:hypothetical protein n=1 Tax=[Phormidium ambiguum] IAM M-71 TaxID=454136 RepID=UPI0015BDB4A8|nr:hypothetical protein [Phormidium ambiguum]
MSARVVSHDSLFVYRLKMMPFMQNSISLWNLYNIAQLTKGKSAIAKEHARDRYCLFS